MRSVETHYLFQITSDTIQDQSAYGKAAIWLIPYLSFSMATTILCTLLIIYRIITVSYGGMGIQTFRGVIEIIVESSLIYSIMLIIYVVLVACDNFGGKYVDILTSSTRVCFIYLLFHAPVSLLLSLQGIAPTLIVGRVAAGHARPDESWEGSISSSLHFEHDSEEQSQGTIDSDVEGRTESSEQGLSLVSSADSGV